MQLESQQHALHQNHCCEIDFKRNEHPFEAGFNHFELMYNLKENDERATI